MIADIIEAQRSKRSMSEYFLRDEGLGNTFQVRRCCSWVKISRDCEFGKAERLFPFSSDVSPVVCILLGGPSPSSGGAFRKKALAVPSPEAPQPVHRDLECLSEIGSGSV